MSACSVICWKTVSSDQQSVTFVCRAVPYFLHILVSLWLLSIHAISQATDENGIAKFNIYSIPQLKLIFCKHGDSRSFTSDIQELPQSLSR